MKLASGTAPVPKYLAAGVSLGLGTDGAASNNDLDMFEAMRQAAFLHKLQTGDPRAVPAAAVLDMATRGGAAALGMSQEIGSLEPGKRADLVVLSDDVFTCADERIPEIRPTLTLLDGEIVFRG
jgi:5-methylthioadenosine/S-adenosylhomocysteine deaminase